MELKPEHAPKKESTFEWSRRKFKEKYGDAVKTQWRVEEWRLAYTEYGYDGRDFPAKFIEASEWFDTKELAADFMSKNVAGKHNELKLKSRTLYRKWIEPQAGYWKETWI